MRPDGEVVVRTKAIAAGSQDSGTGYPEGRGVIDPLAETGQDVIRRTRASGKSGEQG